MRTPLLLCRRTSDLQSHRHHAACLQVSSPMLRTVLCERARCYRMVTKSAWAEVVWLREAAAAATEIRVQECNHLRTSVIGRKTETSQTRTPKSEARPVSQVTSAQRFCCMSTWSCCVYMPALQVSDGKPCPRGRLAGRCCKSPSAPAKRATAEIFCIRCITTDCAAVFMAGAMEG